ncbi:MAG: cation transporter [Firmicutes bacterium]|nr:cation transporter [Bacillota bacterium]
MGRNMDDRTRDIIKYNLISIGLNLVLSVLKLIIGFSVHSRAIALDAINGFSDMMSAGIAILSATAASRKADKAHPLGYGRLEYLSSLAVTVLIMYMGLRAIIDSVKDIIHPITTPDYNTAAVIIILASIACKIGYGLLLRRAGKRLNNVSLVMTGTEGMGDALISVSILAAVIVLRAFHLNIEPILCIIISLSILATSLGMLRECMNKIIGTRPEPDFERTIKRALIDEEGVLGVSNLVIHTYGENTHVGSVDIEVDESTPAAGITRLSRRLIRRAKAEGLILTSVGVTASNLNDPRAAEIWDTILYRLHEHPGILRAQLFTVDFEEKVISFYVVLDYGQKNRDDAVRLLQEDLEQVFPDMTIEIHESIDI